MKRINTINQNDYIVLTQTMSNNIQMNTYDERSFEGTRVTLTKEQAKQLVNKLQEMIYADDDFERIPKHYIDTDMVTPKTPLNKTFSQHDCCSYGHCPVCNKSVSMYDNKCSCGQYLKWR